MALVLVIQLQGQGARNLSADEGRGLPRYVADVHCVLDTLKIPMPQSLVPIWKSGIIRGIYSNEAANSMFYNALDAGFARARRVPPLLEKYSIKVLKLVDASRNKKCFLSSDREPHTSLADYMYPPRSLPSSAGPSRSQRSNSDTANRNTVAPNKRRRVSANDHDIAMERLLSISRSTECKPTDVSTSSAQTNVTQNVVSPSRRYDHYNSSLFFAPRSASGDAVELAQRTLWDTRRELGTLRSKETALISRLKQLGETDPTTCWEVLSPEESKNSVYLKGAQLAKLEDDLRSVQIENQTLHSQLQAERSRRKQLEELLSKAHGEENSELLFIPAMLSAMESLSRLSQEVLEAARKDD